MDMPFPFLSKPLGGLGRIACLLIFAVISGFLSMPCLCRTGTIIGKYCFILMIIFFIRLVIAHLRKKMTPGLVLFYQTAFIAFYLLAWHLAGH